MRTPKGSTPPQPANSARFGGPGRGHSLGIPRLPLCRSAPARSPGIDGSEEWLTPQLKLGASTSHYARKDGSSELEDYACTGIDVLDVIGQRCSSGQSEEGA